MSIKQQAAQLLDFSQKFDVTLLDNVVACGLGGAVQGPEQQVCQHVLTQLKDHPDAWTRVDMILEFSTSQSTKFYALGILQDVIKSRWKALSREQCEGIKTYIVGLIIKLSSDSSALTNELLYLNKLNAILVQIVKHEWPRNWPTFIGDIVGASKTNESLCQNNLAILKILSEEIFDFSAGVMTQNKAKHLKDTMCDDFPQIFELCTFVMHNSQSVSLVHETLETLQRFITWMPLGYIFRTKLVPTLIYKFLNVPEFRNVTLRCLTEVASITFSKEDEESAELFCTLFSLTLSQLKQMLPLTTNIKEAYKNGRDAEQAFILNLSMFLCTFLKVHGTLLEAKSGMHDHLLEALHFLVLISEVEEKEIFKICLEYWSTLTFELYLEKPFPGDPSQQQLSRRPLYYPVLSKVRLIMISNMAKPEEVVVVENEAGEVVRETMVDTDAVSLYKTMRATLVYLTHLDWYDTERIMTEKLESQVNGSEWSWKNLNRLCWAIGSISGATVEENEKRFLVTVIKELLGMVEMKRGKDNKAIIASNIMYIVGQYPRFLRAHWKFLKTVVKKLFEFMHELHDGVQDMACDTFIKIAQKCRRHFVFIQVGETEPYIREILKTISSIICDLQPQQVHTFYEAVGYMISAQTDSLMIEPLIEKYFELPNSVWDSIIQQATKDVTVLQGRETAKQLSNILKTNIAGCGAIGHAYVTQLGRIYLDMLNVYKVLSENISTAIATHGEQAAKQPQLVAMRAVKQDVLRLISTWISKSHDHKMVLDNFIPPFLDAVLADYHRNVPSAREPLVLSALATTINHLGECITGQVPVIFDAVFECTLEMINKDFEEFPEHRTNFFTMLQAVTEHCFPAFLQMPSMQFKLIMDSIIWAFKHTMRNVAETGLNILLTLLKSVELTEAAQGFYGTYYLLVLQHIFSVVTDSSHTADLQMHATILARMFYIVEGGTVTCPLYEGDSSVTAPTTNQVYVAEFVAQLLGQAYPHLQEQQRRVLVEGFFSLDTNINGFRDHLRDFLVQIREIAGEDPSDLYLEERKQQLREAAEEKLKQQAAVPGVLNPHELPDEMES